LLALGRSGIAVQPRAGTLISRQRRQTHPVEQLRCLLMEHCGLVMGGSRTLVRSFNVRHAQRLPFAAVLPILSPETGPQGSTAQDM
jgi:hypothetical protein